MTTKVAGAEPARRRSIRPQTTGRTHAVVRAASLDANSGASQPSRSVLPDAEPQ